MTGPLDQDSAASGESAPLECALAIDLGGTRFRTAAVTRDGRLVARTAHETRAHVPAEDAIADLAAAVAEICSQLSKVTIVGLGVAAPGPLDHVAGIVFQAPNLPLWHDVPLAEHLSSLTGLRAVIGNDANLAALAEARSGAGHGARNLVYLTVSTGVGSGIVIEGKLLLGEHGAAAEAGHMAISLDGPLCPCGNHGCLEAFASGTALARRAREALAGGRQSSLAEDSELTAVDIAAAAEHGDALANELISEAGHALGIGVRSLLHLFNPSVVVIGGGVSRIGPRLWEPMLEVVNTDAMESYRRDLRVVPAELGDDSGLVGAGLYVFDTLASSDGGGAAGTQESDPGSTRQAQ